MGHLRFEKHATPGNEKKISWMKKRSNGGVGHVTLHIAILLSCWVHVDFDVIKSSVFYFVLHETVVMNDTMRHYNQSIKERLMVVLMEEILHHLRCIEP